MEFWTKRRRFKTSKWIVEKLCELIPNSDWMIDSTEQPYEAVQLKLDSSKAIEGLIGLRQWNIENALYKTVEWHLSWKNNKDMEKSNRCSNN